MPRTGFVAMCFDPSLDSAYSDGIKPAIGGAGYHPLRVDEVHHNEKYATGLLSRFAALGLLSPT